jgi:hypothetical protein
MLQAFGIQHCTAPQEGSPGLSLPSSALSEDRRYMTIHLIKALPFCLKTVKKNSFNLQVVSDLPLARFKMLKNELSQGLERSKC